MQRHSFPFRAMACDNTITLFSSSVSAANAAARAAIAEVARIEAKYSRYRPDSVVSRINLQAGGTIATPIDAETASLLDFAEACYQQSDGLFDITSGVLRRVWDFTADKPPTIDAINAVLPLIGWARVARGVGGTQQTVYLPDVGMEIDFGGFGKEYAADRAAAVLLKHGVVNGFVDLGGDVVVTGPQMDDSPWSLGIRHPRIDDELLSTVTITSGAVATSGDYERYMDIDGRRHSHILDPRTGQSVPGFQSVTAFASTCLVAGGITTIAMLKGEDGGRDWLASVAEAGIRSLAVGANGVPAHYP